MHTLRALESGSGHDMLIIVETTIYCFFNVSNLLNIDVFVKEL
jgi:hypothetical protein